MAVKVTTTDLGITAERDTKRWSTGSYFMALFLPLCLIVGGILAVIYHAELRTDEALIRQQQRQDVNTARRLIISDLRAVAADAVLLSQQSDMQTFLNRDDLHTRHELERDYLTFCTTKRSYDKIRFVEPDGQERLRVEYRDGNPAVVPSSRLQNVSDRHFFEHGMRASPGQIYFGKFDLARDEDGKPVEPYRPVLRCTIAVADPDQPGDVCGLLVLSYLAGVMLQQMEPEQQLLLNEQGHVLHGGKPEHRYGFVMENAGSFARRRPLAWTRILQEREGQVVIPEEGMFTFSRIVPRDIIGRNGAIPAPTDATASEDAFWQVVSHVPPARLYAATRGLRAGLTWFFAVLAVIIAMVSLHYARLIMRRSEMQQKLREYALTDSLTKIYNRRFGLRMLDRLTKECRRLGARLTVFMIDLDGLKRINDRYGHKAGDEVIFQVATALRDGLREVDVVARFGGDEFLVIQPFTMIENGRKGIERVREQLLGGGLKKYAEANVGFSAGGAEFDPRESPSITQLLDAADKAMYEEKRRKREGGGGSGSATQA